MKARSPYSIRASLDHKGLPYEALGDIELVECARQGLADAFAVLHRRHRRRLLVAAFRITKNSEDSEDAVQDAFLRAYRKLGTFKGTSPFSAWLTRILINTCLLQLRQKRRYSSVSLDEAWSNGDSWADSIADTSVDIEREYGERQRLAVLSHAISNLNPVLRVVLETYRSEDCSVAELAARNSISIPAAKSRLLRARAALRACSPSLAQRG